MGVECPGNVVGVDHGSGYRGLFLFVANNTAMAQRLYCKRLFGTIDQDSTDERETAQDRQHGLEKLNINAKIEFLHRWWVKKMEISGERAKNLSSLPDSLFLTCTGGLTQANARARVFLVSRG